MKKHKKKRDQRRSEVGTRSNNIAPEPVDIPEPSQEEQFIWNRDTSLVLLGRIREALGIPAGQNTLLACREIKQLLEFKGISIPSGCENSEQDIKDSTVVRFPFRKQIQMAMSLLEDPAYPYVADPQRDGVNVSDDTRRVGRVYQLCAALHTVSESEPFVLGVSDVAQFLNVDDVTASSIIKDLMRDGSLVRLERAIPGRRACIYRFNPY